MTLRTAITSAIQWLEGNGISIPAELYREARAVGVYQAIKQGTMGEIVSAYRSTIEDILSGFFGGKDTVTIRNRFKRAMVEALSDSIDVGWQEGGEDLPVEGAALDWYNARVDSEMGFIDALIAQAKDLGKDENADIPQWITDRSEAYARSAVAVYNAGRMFAQENQVCYWYLGRTEQHCSTCASLNGKKHRLSWYLSRNYIPRQPGAAMECGGYRCDCWLQDTEGNVVTI